MNSSLVRRVSIVSFISSDLSKHGIRSFLKLHDVYRNTLIDTDLIDSNSGMVRVNNGIITDETIVTMIDVNFETIVGSSFWDLGVGTNTGIINFCARPEVQLSDGSVPNSDETMVVVSVDVANKFEVTGYHVNKDSHNMVNVAVDSKAGSFEMEKRIMVALNGEKRY